MASSAIDPIVSVDPKVCKRCGECEAACPTDVFHWVDGKIETRFPGWCIKCGHCVAACSEHALAHAQLNQAKFSEFGDEPYPAAAELWRLFERRRSCRRFRPEPLPDEQIEDLIDKARYAPTATNAQNVRYLVISSREAIDALARSTAAYYTKLEKQLANPIKRGLISLAVGSKTVEAYRYHMPAIMARFRSTLEGKDQLFYGAPHVIIIFAAGLGHLASANCNLAAMQVLLAAEALELGACYNGYALTALVRERSVRRGLGIPSGYHPGSVIALGKPAAGFFRRPPRRKNRIISI